MIHVDFWLGLTTSLYLISESDYRLRLSENTAADSIRIKCEVCKKFRMQNAFSNRQLDAVRHAVVIHGQEALSDSLPGYAKCRHCTGGQTVELHCFVCDKTKGLDEFSKAQRRNPDSAVRPPLTETSRTIADM
jgi:Stc1 domain